MPSLKTIRKRITSTKSTQKITRAMKTVAGARLSRAQQRIVSLRPYAIKTSAILHDVADALVQAAGVGGSREPLHALLDTRPERRVCFVVLSGDRGLCGGFNANINKATERAWREKKEQGIDVSFVTLGRKGREYLQRRGATVAQDFAKPYDNLDLQKARGITGWLIQRYQKLQSREPEFDAIYLVYNEFKSAITQQTVVERLLPLDAPGAERVVEPTGAPPSLYVYEPDRGVLLERLVPMYVEISILRALLESQASFFGAQMTAMDSASRNAKSMISRLTLLYNRARQASITKELMEIIGGAEALKE